MGEPDTEENRRDSGSRWPSLLFNLVVPGFGHLRAGNVRRGLCWVIGCHLLMLGAILLLVAKNVPVWIPLLVWLVGMLAAMIDNFQPGRMSSRLWMVLAGLIVFNVVVTTARRQFVGRAFKIPTNAMEPTLRGIRDGNSPDLIAAELLSYRIREPQRGDLVVFSTSGIDGIRTVDGEEHFYVKRLIGLPGETIEIRDGRVSANGAILTAVDGVPPIEYTDLRSVDEFQVGQGEYFVLGDNSANSADSRIWGNVPRENVIGKVTKIYWPISRWGTPE